MTNASEDILQRPARPRVIEHLGGGDDRQAERARSRTHDDLACNLIIAAMSGGQCVGAVAKGVA
jgi:hypothetical protein